MAILSIIGTAALITGLFFTASTLRPDKKRDDLRKTDTPLLEDAICDCVLKSRCKGADLQNCGTAELEMVCCPVLLNSTSDLLTSSQPPDFKNVRAKSMVTESTSAPKYKMSYEVTTNLQNQTVFPAGSTSERIGDKREKMKDTLNRSPYDVRSV